MSPFPTPYAHQRLRFAGVVQGDMNGDQNGTDMNEGCGECVGREQEVCTRSDASDATSLSPLHSSCLSAVCVADETCYSIGHAFASSHEKDEVGEDQAAHQTCDATIEMPSTGDMSSPVAGQLASAFEFRKRGPFAPKPVVEHTNSSPTGQNDQWFSDVLSASSSQFEHPPKACSARGHRRGNPFCPSRPEPASRNERKDRLDPERRDNIVLESGDDGAPDTQEIPQRSADELSTAEVMHLSERLAQYEDSLAESTVGEVSSNAVETPRNLREVLAPDQDESSSLSAPGWTVGLEDHSSMLSACSRPPAHSPASTPQDYRQAHSQMSVRSRTTSYLSSPAYESCASSVGQSPRGGHETQFILEQLVETGALRELAARNGISGLPVLRGHDSRSISGMICSSPLVVAADPPPATLQPGDAPEFLSPPPQCLGIDVIPSPASSASAALQLMYPLAEEKLVPTPMWLSPPLAPQATAEASPYLPTAQSEVLQEKDTAPPRKDMPDAPQVEKVLLLKDKNEPPRVDVSPSKKGAGKGSGPPPPKGGPPKRGDGMGKVEPRMPNVVPTVPLRKLFWTPLEAPLEGSSQQTVWDKIHRNGATFDVGELEALFSEMPKHTARTSGSDSTRHTQSMSSRHPLVRRKRLFQEARRRKIWFMLALMPDRSLLPEFIVKMDDSILQADKVELLLSNLLDASEEASLKASAEEAVLAENEMWDIPESFMIMLVSIPQFTLRLQVWGFVNAFDALQMRLAAAEADMRSACDCLKASEGIEKLLALSLYVGNYLNGGTVRGRADGFDIDTLAKLGKLKVSQKGTDETLVDFISGQIDRDDSRLLPDMYLPGAEFQKVHRARRHSLSDTKDELNGLMKQGGDLLQRIDQNVLKPDDALVCRRAQVAEELGRLQLLSSRFDALGVKYTELCAWFRMDTEKPRPSDEFFGIWDLFLTDVQRACDAIEKRRRSSARRSSSRSLMQRRRSLPSELGQADLPALRVPAEDASDSRHRSCLIRRRASMPLLVNDHFVTGTDAAGNLS